MDYWPPLSLYGLVSWSHMAKLIKVSTHFAGSNKWSSPKWIHFFFFFSVLMFFLIFLPHIDYTPENTSMSDKKGLYISKGKPTTTFRGTCEFDPTLLLRLLRFSPTSSCDSGVVVKFYPWELTWPSRLNGLNFLGWRIFSRENKPFKLFFQGPLAEWGKFEGKNSPDAT